MEAYKCRDGEQNPFTTGDGGAFQSLGVSNVDQVGIGNLGQRLARNLQFALPNRKRLHCGGDQGGQGLSFVVRFTDQRGAFFAQQLNEFRIHELIVVRNVEHMYAFERGSLTERGQES